uniref:Uncharacterized protein n=1 Tax=Arundo donax TaxID=35708 RepID=A0A0A9AS84_ARUDO
MLGDGGGGGSMVGCGRSTAAEADPWLRAGTPASCMTRSRASVLPWRLAAWRPWRASAVVAGGHVAASRGRALRWPGQRGQAARSAWAGGRGQIYGAAHNGRLRRRRANSTMMMPISSSMLTCVCPVQVAEALPASGDHAACGSAAAVQIRFHDWIYLTSGGAHGDSRTTNSTTTTATSSSMATCVCPFLFLFSILLALLDGGGAVGDNVHFFFYRRIGWSNFFYCCNPTVQVLLMTWRGVCAENGRRLVIDR